MATSSAIALVAAIVLVVTVPLAARAQERGAGVSNTDDAIAQAHFKAGQGHYKAGRFDEAGTEFLKAYELSKRPALLYNAYVAYRDGGNDEWAAKALRQYLAEEPEVADRPLLEARLVTLEERLAEKARRDAAAAEAAEQEAEETRAAEAQAEADAAGPGPWPWVLVGVGGALVVGGIATGIATQNAIGNLEDECPGNICDQDRDLTEDESDIGTLAAVTDVLWITGAVVVAGGLAWWLLTDDDESDAAAPAVTAGCGPTGCAAQVEVRF